MAESDADADADSVPETAEEKKSNTVKLAGVALLGFFLIFIASLAGSFIFINVKNSGREPIKIERKIAVADFDIAHAQTVSTRVQVLETEGDEIRVVLEGRFRKSFGDPLLITKNGRNVTIKIDEAQEGSHRAELTIFIPSEFTKKLEVETVSGRIDASVSLPNSSHVSMSSVSGQTALTTH